MTIENAWLTLLSIVNLKNFRTKMLVILTSNFQLQPFNNGYLNRRTAE